MRLAEYFTQVTGKGVLATSDSSGKVDAAIYSKPHCNDDGTLAFIMLDRLTHHNLQSNPHAAYLFIEHSESHKGLRLFLKKTAESQDKELIASMQRTHLSPGTDQASRAKFLVFFTVEQILPLVGSGEPGVTV